MWLFDLQHIAADLSGVSLLGLTVTVSLCHPPAELVEVLSLTREKLFWETAHATYRCSATQHIRTQFPVLDFSLSSLRAFLHDQASEVQLYYFVAAVMKFACTVPFHPP